MTHARAPSTLGIQHLKDDPSRVLWGSLVATIVAGQGDLWGQYQWPDGTACTLLERVWSEPVSAASWDEVDPLVQACWGRGHPPMLVSPVRSVLAVVEDPAKLQGWLDLGNDPFALHAGAPVWWDLIHRGRLDLLDVVATHPGWARWAHLNNATGRTVTTHWATGGSPDGLTDPRVVVVAPSTTTASTSPPVPKSLSVGDSLAVLNWLQQRLGDRASLDEAFWHALLDRVQAVTEQPQAIDRRPSALQQWDVLVRHQVPGEKLPGVEKAWRTWNNAHRRFKPKHPTVHHRIALALEHRTLQKMVEDDPHVDHRPTAARRRL